MLHRASIVEVELKREAGTGVTEAKHSAEFSNEAGFGTCLIDRSYCCCGDGRLKGLA